MKTYHRYEIYVEVKRGGDEGDEGDEEDEEDEG